MKGYFSFGNGNQGIFNLPYNLFVFSHGNFEILEFDPNSLSDRAKKFRESLTDLEHKIFKKQLFAVKIPSEHLTQFQDYCFAGENYKAKFLAFEIFNIAKQEALYKKMIDSAKDAEDEKYGEWWKNDERNPFDFE